jgi:hypothetical protein
MRIPFYITDNEIVIYYPCSGIDLHTIIRLLNKEHRHVFFKNKQLTFIFIDANVEAPIGCRHELFKLEDLFYELGFTVNRREHKRIKDEYLDIRNQSIAAIRNEHLQDSRIDIKLFDQYYTGIEEAQNYTHYDYYRLEYEAETIRLYFVYDDAYLALDIFKKLNPNQERNLILMVPGGGWMPTSYLWSPESPLIRLFKPYTIYTCDFFLRGLKERGYSELCFIEDNYLPWFRYESISQRREKQKTFLKNFYSK